MSKPRVKFNNGNPVALCNECSVITHYITYNDDDSFYIKGTEKDVPELCDKCSENDAIEKAKAIIKSSTTLEHLDAAMNYLDLYLKTFSNGIIYHDLIELLRDRKTEINLNKI